MLTKRYYIPHASRQLAQESTMKLRKKAQWSKSSYLAKKLLMLWKNSFLAMVNWMQYYTNFDLLNLMLCFVVLSSFSLLDFFQFSSTFFVVSTVSSFLPFSIPFLLLCCFNIVFIHIAVFIHCIVYYTNKLIRLIRNHSKMLKCCNLKNF